MNSGRPKKTTNDFPEGWEKHIIDLSNEGASITEIVSYLEISKNTLVVMTERNDQFLTTIKKCKQLCETWWEKKGRKNMENKDFNSTLWYMNMRNRFGWADKVKQDVNTVHLDVTELMTDDELESKLKLLNGQIES